MFSVPFLSAIFWVGLSPSWLVYFCIDSMEVVKFGVNPGFGSFLEEFIIILYMNVAILLF